MFWISFRYLTTDRFNITIRNGDFYDRREEETGGPLYELVVNPCGTEVHIIIHSLGHAGAHKQREGIRTGESIRAKSSGNGHN